MLSLRDYDATKGDCVKHYKMRNMDNGGVYIAVRRTFNSIIELVEHYKGLTCFTGFHIKFSDRWSEEEIRCLFDDN